MASRLTSFLGARRTALLWSAAAAAASLSLSLQWLSFKADQAVFLLFYLRTAPHFPGGEADRLAPSPDILVISALAAGFTLAFALFQWRLGPR